MDQASLEFESCYRAILVRDARFDGMFYTAVSSTGIYCRPVCPAKTPRRGNCSFYLTAAAAERAGFRPCLRCRPELAPGRSDFSETMAWSIYCRLAEGALDHGSVEALARDFGMSSRHMRRLLLDHFGVTPIEVAQTQRLLFAKKLLHETGLPMLEVALASGFASLRRFNAAFIESYHMSPSALRRERTHMLPEGDVVTLRLSYRPPLDWPYWLQYLELRAIAGIEAVAAGVYRRTLRMTSGAKTLTGWFEVCADAKRHVLVVKVPRHLSACLVPLSQRVRQLFDLDANPRLIAEQLKNATLIGPHLKDASRLRVPGAWDAFELGIRAVLGQQVSVRGASTLAQRLAQRYCDALEDAPAGLAYLPPEPVRIAAIGAAELASIGVPRSRAVTLVEFARFAAQGGLVFPFGAKLGDIVARLKQVPGIGDWTAHYIAMRALRQADAFPSGDLGLRHAAARLSGHAEKPLSARALNQLSENWRPWRAYAASQLWSSLAKELS